MEDETVILGWGERGDYKRQSCGTPSCIVMTAAQSKGAATGPFRYGRRADAMAQGHNVLSREQAEASPSEFSG